MPRSRIGAMQNIAPAAPVPAPWLIPASSACPSGTPTRWSSTRAPRTSSTTTTCPARRTCPWSTTSSTPRSAPRIAPTRTPPTSLGVEYSLRNIARHIRTLITRFDPDSRMLVYCFRGGKRSKLWADNLRTIGYRVDVLEGGWKRYRLWVRESLDALPARLELKVLAGATGCGKTRLLHALRAAGEQVLDLEALASHRGSLIGAIPGERQPTQKLFDSQVLEALRRMDPQRPIWLEAESRKIGNLHLPAALHEAMHRSVPIRLVAPMSERVKLWREDYAHFARDPASMVRLLAPLKPLIGGGELARWQALAAAGEVDTLFERVMTAHYDPCYDRSTKGSYGKLSEGAVIELQSLDAQALLQVARDLVE